MRINKSLNALLISIYVRQFATIKYLFVATLLWWAVDSVLSVIASRGGYLPALFLGMASMVVFSGYLFNFFFKTVILELDIGYRTIIRGMSMFAIFNDRSLMQAVLRLAVYVIIAIMVITYFPEYFLTPFFSAVELFNEETGLSLVALSLLMVMMLCPLIYFQSCCVKTAFKSSVNVAAVMELRTVRTFSLTGPAEGLLRKNFVYGYLLNIAISSVSVYLVMVTFNYAMLFLVPMVTAPVFMSAMYGQAMCDMQEAHDVHRAGRQC
ncbi:hypothetical protein [Vibrio mediterranei]|uniref:hypothetical protein n=1 Tax=Vibrio mediterranei TaxID=689 RepID=UPI00406765BF